MFEMTRRGLLVMALVACVCGCSSSSGNAIIPQGVIASFVGSGTAASANMMRAVGDASGDLVTVEVMVGGPTTSADLFSFAFDLVLGDATVAEYVSGSVSAGSALTTSGSQSLQALAVQQGDRIAVGVTKLGGTGNGVTATGESTLVQFQFRLLKAGTTPLTIDGPPGSAPAALDSTGATIGSITFDASSATLIGI